MVIYKANISIEIDDSGDDTKKFIDELETFCTFKPMFNIFGDFIGLEATYKGVVRNERSV